ncbi:MAG: hypothetical protein OMM_02841 [Candidatus Magnetoglobus multicellularis str. Araruama]|uniref:Uncharacterized protein n=1 Tax=Candidatus Magnetoglobus multicellularis str. Araruama TaxID=890399 RepID=A0A1V1P890_9BACT|nr:MAG: hypothetical protein OMM_02841 [Candidatus Magnetoglobus multicellularis str. Araruama]
MKMTPQKKISITQTYRDFIDHYQDPNQIAPFLGKVGAVQSLFFWIKQWIAVSIPVILCVLYLGGMDQISLSDTFGVKVWVEFCLTILIRLFQPEGLVAMLSLILIECFFCVQLASGWHKKLARKSHSLYCDLGKQVCTQMMITLHESLHPLIQWSQRAQADCLSINKLFNQKKQ